MDHTRFETFTKSRQIACIGSELMRAHVWQKPGEGKNFSGALERALELTDQALNDKKWNDNIRMVLGLRDEIAKFYTRQRTDDIINLYHML